MLSSRKESNWIKKQKLGESCLTSFPCAVLQGLLGRNAETAQNNEAWGLGKVFITLLFPRMTNIHFLLALSVDNQKEKIVRINIMIIKGNSLRSFIKCMTSYDIVAKKSSESADFFWRLTLS